MDVDELPSVMVEDHGVLGVAYTRLFRPLAATRCQRDHTGTSRYLNHTGIGRDRDSKKGGV